MHCLWPRQRENISAKTLMALKPRIFSLVNLSLSTVLHIQITTCIDGAKKNEMRLIYFHHLFLYINFSCIIQLALKIYYC